MAEEEESGAAVPGSAEWRVEMRRKRERYEAQRRRWTTGWYSGGRLEPMLDESDGRNRSGRIIHDRRQFRFDV